MKKNNKGGKPLDLTNSIKPPVRQHKKELKAKTPGQQEYIDAIDSHEIILCDGVAGTGKTHIACALSTKYLLAKKVDKIIITRPMVSSEKDVGALPGTMEDKISPFLQPIYDELAYYVSYSDITAMKNSRELYIVPFAYMRGLSFNNAFVIIDEAQNCTFNQLKMVLSRIGKNSKMILIGDCEQSDLPDYLSGGFDKCIDKLYDIPEIAIIELGDENIVRNPIISKILNRLK